MDKHLHSKEIINIPSYFHNLKKFSHAKRTQTMNEVTAAQKREKKAQAEAQENAEERDRLEDKFIGE